jgi:tetratricopeptide (TPR) repeat protein
MVDLKPNLDSYARVSYLRELRGDLAGALEAMRLAASAGGEAPENFAYVQSLLGDLELGAGRIAAAEREYRSALARYPGFLAAETGLARVAGSKGELAPAIRRYRRVVAAVPDPADLTVLGELELAAGRGRAGRADLAEALDQERLVIRRGAPDADTVLLEANHGSREEAVRLGRRVWRTLPSVRSADALGWALTRTGRPVEGLAWAKRALRLGSVYPPFLYHAGMAAKAAGRPELASGYLERALARNPGFSPLYAARARRALAQVR